MSKEEGCSRIPVVRQPLSKLSSLSARVRARAEQAALLGLLKRQTPPRPSGFGQPFAPPLQRPPDPPPPPTPADHRCSFLSDDSPSMPFQGLSMGESPESGSSVRLVLDSGRSKHSSFEGDDSLGILTPDQMDDLELASSPLLGIEELTLVSIDSSSAPAPVTVDPKRRSPSVEELPLDVDNSKAVAASFVTSVTSITSLDNGYQGDGEWSRPASRGPEQSPSKVRPRPDPMTDSDFFTESDADPHDDLLRGDRRAQVIDGTLYGAQTREACPGPVFSPFEEMDSSGVFSDLERRPDDPPEPIRNEPLPSPPDEERPVSPEGSTRTVSSKSDQSLKKICQPSISERIKEQVKNITGLMAMEIEPQLTEPPRPNQTSDEAPKTKTPKRTVVSKIKTMMTSGGRKETEAKKGRWDAVMSKISSGGCDRSRLREVKSRVCSGLRTTVTTPRPVTPAASTRSLRDMKPLKARRCRGLRSSECSLTATPVTGSRQSPASSRNSSVSDLSHTNKSPNTNRSVKKRDSVRSGSPQNEVSSAKKPAVSSPPKTKATGKVSSPGDKTSSVRKVIGPRRTASATHVQKPASNGAVPNGKAEKTTSGGRGGKGCVAVSPPAVQCTPAPATTCAPAQVVPCNPEPLSAPAPPPAPHPLAVEALSVLLNHLVVNYDAFSTPRLRRELIQVKGEHVETKLELEQLRSSFRRLEEELTNERNVYQQKQCLHLEELESVNKVSSGLEDQLRKIQLKYEQQGRELECVHEKNAADSVRLAEEAKAAASCSEAAAAAAEEAFCLRTERDALLLERDSLHAECDALQVIKDEHGDCAGKIAELERRIDDLRSGRQLFMESLNVSDRDSKIKVAASARSSELEAEVDSLRSVLELRCTELQELRRQSQAWQLDAEQLPTARHAVKAARAQIETLQQKLAAKETIEKSLLKENESLNQALKQGLAKNKRLSLQNEELTYKLKENSRVVYTLANMSVDQKVYHSPAMRNARKFHKNTSTPFKAYDNDSEESENKGWSECLSDGSEGPASPKIKGVVEKGDSVSWTLDMDEPAELSLSRILRRATSLRTPGTERPLRSPSSKSLSYATPEKDQVILVKDGEDISFFDVDDGEDIEIEANLRPKSEEELEMLRRVESGGRCGPKDLAGEAMVSGGASDEDDMVLEDEDSHHMDLS